VYGIVVRIQGHGRDRKGRGGEVSRGRAEWSSILHWLIMEQWYLALTCDGEGQETMKQYGTCDTMT
jgi:hypothetical protein